MSARTGGRWGAHFIRPRSPWIVILLAVLATGEALSQRGTTSLVSAAANGSLANGDTGSSQFWSGTNRYSYSVSADGRYVAFESSASNLTPQGGNAYIQIYLR